MSKHLTLEEKLAAIVGTGGILTTIAKKAGVDRSTVRRWRDTDEQFALAVAEAHEIMLDRAEKAGYAGTQMNALLPVEPA